MTRQLAKKTRSILEDASDAERIRRIRTPRWIDYKAAQVIHSKLNDLLTHPVNLRMPNLLVVSQTNNGKTALVNEFCRANTPENPPGAEATTTPILLVQAPPVPDPAWLMAALLDGLAIPRKRRDDPYVMIARLSRVLPKLGVQVLIIDEIHHLLAGNSVRQKWFLNVIKYLGNELKLPIVAVGTQDAFNAISTDPQLANRFEPAVLPRENCRRCSIEQPFEPSALAKSGSRPNCWTNWNGRHPRREGKRRTRSHRGGRRCFYHSDQSRKRMNCCPHGW
ncbi:MAG TPA: TniB family NTP-binding protein [Edaphobacter sp.]|nr:TniB family NTP-binding protein [Edaphobacter sp.]